MMYWPESIVTWPYKSSIDSCKLATEPQKQRPSILVSFTRYQLVAILATGVDFVMLVFLTEIFGLWYLFSTITGATFGAITAFLLGRYWVFQSKEDKIHNQAFRYVIVAAGSVFLNSAGVYLLTDIVGLQYMISKVITAVIVGISYNYLLSRHFIFK